MNPRKPTNIKLVQGTFRKDRVARNEAKPTIEIPPVPEHLSDIAKVEWGRISQDLAQLGLLSRIDRSALCAYCDCWGDYIESSKLCATTEGKDRKVIKTAAGNLIENPYYSIKKRSLELMHKYLTEFGMSPASRTKIDASPLPAGNAGNPFAQIG